MTNSEKDIIIKSCEAALNSGNIDHVTVNFERKTLESLVSMLKRIQSLRCVNIVADETFSYYSREEFENFIKKEISYCLVDKLIESNMITYSTEKDRNRLQTKITTTLNIIEPEVKK